MHGTTNPKLCYGLDGPEFDVSDLHNVQTGSGKHPASSSMGNGSSSVGSKAAGACSWPLTST